MKPKLAMKRYLTLMIGSSLSYIGTVFAVSFTHDNFIDGSIPAVLLSLVPGVPLCLMVWSVWRYLQEADEVVRHDLTQAMLIGLFVLLGLSGCWGLAELFNDSMPRLPIFFAFPAFFLVYGLASATRYKRCV